MKPLREAPRLSTGTGGVSTARTSRDPRWTDRDRQEGTEREGTDTRDPGRTRGRGARKKGGGSGRGRRSREGAAPGDSPRNDAEGKSSEDDRRRRRDDGNDGTTWDPRPACAPGPKTNSYTVSALNAPAAIACKKRPPRPDAESPASQGEEEGEGGRPDQRRGRRGRRGGERSPSRGVWRRDVASKAAGPFLRPARTRKKTRLCRDVS